MRRQDSPRCKAFRISRSIQVRQEFLQIHFEIGTNLVLQSLDGLARFRWAGASALTPGNHTIAFDFKYNGPGPGKGGTGVLSVDGKQVATQSIPHTIPFIMTADETFDVGVDTRTPVDYKDYQVPFRFTGKLDKLTFKLGPEELMPEHQKAKAEALASVHS